MTTISREMGLTDWASIVMLSILWGGSYFFVGVAVADINPFLIVFGRVAIGALVLGCAVRLAGVRMPMTVAYWRPLFMMSILNNIVPWTLITWGQTEIASGLAAILNATTPLFTVVLANRFTADEKLTPGKIAGIAIGIAGVVVLIGPDALQGLGTAILAQVAMLLASFPYAMSSVFARRFHDRPPVASAAGQMICSTVLMVPPVLAFAPPWAQAVPGPASIAAILCLGVLSTAFGYLLVFRILRSAGATNFSLVTFLLPVTAVVLGYMLLGERLDPRVFAGAGLIGLGLAAIDGRPAAMLRRGLRGSRS
ncbi:DMT family transporter [Microbaculum marinum]|uniref:DMT family transporter n=1 Tax=Microbaculum marinum TaxID=1764581 RepID=A0AAW9RQG0_9HYPH